MSRPPVNQIPNILTTLRLFLAAPICLFILDENYGVVLWIAFVAGISDGLDGWLARKMGAESRYGSIVDPLSDKAMLTGAFVSFAVVGVLPWWVVTIVVVRDVIIVSGAVLCHRLLGRYKIAPSLWGKTSTAIQITFILMLLIQQVTPLFPDIIFRVVLWIMIAMVFISGGDYIHTWGRKVLIKGK